MDQALRSRGFAKGFFVMESNGGVLTVDAAKERPVLLMESGPVGGAIASAKLGDLLDHPNVVAFDMGGTTAKACVIEGGIPPVTDIYWVGRYARGYPVQMPFVEVLEVGAGGGSIIWIDEVGALKIGPRSAGASPGPACFGFGGADATITDAHMFLGAISSSAFMSGGMTLDPAASETAIRSVADKLGVDPTRVASGAVKIANATMAEFVRRTTIERGRDPREFVMVAYGGAGPLHARDVAEELGIPVVVIPPLPGNFSAIGMSVADLRHDYVRTFAAPVGTSTLQTLELELQSMEHEARERIEVEVGSDVEIPVHRFADMRYVGQEHAVKVPLPPTITDADLESMIGAFNAEYHARYGHSSPEVDVELVNLRLSAMARVKEGMSLERIGAMDGTREGPPPSTQRDVFFEQAGGFVSCPIYKRDDLRAGDRFTGPAIVEDASSTVVVGVRDTVGVNELGCLVIQVGGPS
jgi:N-methylhydantoinase A